MADNRTDSKLKALFDLARKNHIVARENYWCCSSCGGSGIWQRAEALHKQGKEVRGYLFYHYQDYERAWKQVFGRHAERKISLRYGAYPEDDRVEGVRLGQLIVKLAMDSGFSESDIEWDGDPGTVIELRVSYKDMPNFAYGKKKALR